MTEQYGGSAPVGRRAARLAEKRRRRRRTARLVGVLVVVLVLAAGVALLAGRGQDAPPAAAPVRTQQTVLLQVRDADGTAAASALLAHDPKPSEGGVVLVPPQVVVTVPGSGSQLFGRVLRTSGATSARDALSDLMGITVDASWVLDRASFHRLVDQVGGVQVTVDVPVVRGRVVLLQPGAQRLDGSRALSFATYLGAGEEEQTRLARLQSVLDAVLRSLPDDPGTLLASLGGGSQSGLPAAALARLVDGLRDDGAADQLQYRSLPVVKVDAGTDETRFRVDPAGTRSLVDDLLAASVPKGAREEGNRVLVLNGVGTPGLGQAVRAKLVPAGFVFVGSRNADSFGYATTQVLVADATTAGTALGQRVARALGVPASSVRVSTQLGTVADVVVIVGKDFTAGA